MRHRVIPVAATVEVDGSDPGLWAAQVSAGDPRLDGLFAWGDSFEEARQGLAQVVLAALEVGGATSVAGVQVFATTRKTFLAAELRESRR